MVNNAINYTSYDILRCFLLADKKKDRKKLSDELNLGEGIIRKILERLKSKGFLESTNKGHVLTKKGEKTLKLIMGKFSLHEFRTKNYFARMDKSLVIIHKARTRMKSFEIRDLAIKNGAEACLIFYYKDELLMPPGDFIPREFRGLEKRFSLKSDSYMIITIAKEKKWAQISALAVAVELTKIQLNLL